MSRSKIIGPLFILSLLLVSCSPSPRSQLATGTPEPHTPQVATELPATATPFPAPSATLGTTLNEVHFVWIAPYISQAFIDHLTLPANMIRTESMVSADYYIEVGDGELASQWIFALVAPFPTVQDGISTAALKDFWQGLNTGLFNNRPLLLDENTYQVFSLTWGSPAAGTTDVHPSEDLLTIAWENQPSWALVPFEALEPRWKVLNLDGITPLDPAFDPLAYPLSVSISLDAAPNAHVSVDQLQIRFPTSNLNPEQMTRVAVTGVTALVRGTAIFIDAKGIHYPAEETGTLLRSADITHISNEVPFFSQCPKPELYPAEIRFCSDPAYFAVLEDVGTDVVELTGDHFGDFGTEAMQETLNLYRAKGIPYYGGGENANQARQAVTFEHHGNQIAFIGCNAKGIAYYASATETSPGAVACDMDWLAAEVTRLKAAGYLVIATFQHIEYDAYDPDPVLKNDMQRIARAGAVIVSGSQAHQPHGMAFLERTFIHYGLGNLFFDQYRYYLGGELDYGFIDWHIFYAGKYISTQLMTISWVDLAKNRLTTPAEREKFLGIIFNASQWVIDDMDQP